MRMFTRGARADWKVHTGAKVFLLSLKVGLEIGGRYTVNYGQSGETRGNVAIQDPKPCPLAKKNS